MTSYLEFSDLAAELLSNIYLHTSNLQDLLALSRTCHRLRNLFNTRKVTYLTNAISAQYGPLTDAVQLVTYNSSQPAHIPRNLPVSIALLKEVVQVGRVAAAWQDIYPHKHWHTDYVSRRVLTSRECYLLRRSVYRLWLYSRAFHEPATPRHHRMNPLLLSNRTRLLHNWSNAELAEMADMQAVLREVLKTNVCPSNGTIGRKFRKRFPETNHQLLFNMHLNYPAPASGTFKRHGGSQPPGAMFNMESVSSSLSTVPYSNARMQQQYKHYAKYRPTSTHDPGFEGWGDDIAHYYVIEDMLKLHPGQVLWLQENCVSKWQVEDFVGRLGDWFENNGETWGQTLEMVLKERGMEPEVFWSSVDDGVAGVAVEEV